MGQEQHQIRESGMLGWAELVLVLMREVCEGWPEKEPARSQG